MKKVEGKECYERGDIFENENNFYILMSIPLDEKRDVWAFNLIGLENGNRLYESSIKELELSLGIKDMTYVNRCDVIYKSDPLFTFTDGIKYVCSKETMEHIFKTLQLISET